MIDQEKAREYQQVAALVCSDMDLLAEVAKGCETLEELKWQVEDFRRKKEEYIRNPEVRRRQYAAGCIIWGAVAAGLVRSDPV